MVKKNREMISGQKIRSQTKTEEILIFLIMIKINQDLTKKAMRKTTLRIKVVIKGIQ